MSVLACARSILVAGAALGGASAHCLLPPKPIHVSVRVFDLNNNPVGGLTSASFTLMSSTGTPVPCALEVPQTHLLLILSPGQGELTPAGVSTLAHRLWPLWKAGWLISIHDAQGRQTEYLAGETILRATIRNTVLLTSSVPDAIGTLAEFPGHRVVFVQTGPSFTVDPDTIRRAQQFHAMLYRIGGPRSNRFQPQMEVPAVAYTSAVVQGIPAAGRLVSPGGFFASTAPTPYLHEETTFRAAARDAQLDAAAFYDLRLVVPPDTSNLTLAVKATAFNTTSYRVTAQPWAEGSEPLPSLTIR